MKYFRFEATYRRKNKRNITKEILTLSETIAEAFHNAVNIAMCETLEDEILVAIHFDVNYKNEAAIENIYLGG